MVRGRWSVPVAVLAVVVVAEVAMLALAPRDAVVRVPAEDVPPARSYFSDRELDRASDFRGPQRTLFVARLVLEGGLLVWLVVRPPRALRTGPSPPRRPILAAGAAGAAVAVALTVVTLPVSAISRQRGIDVGLVTQSWPGWVEDVVRSTAISAVLTGAGAALGVALVRRYRRRWWIPASALVVAFAVGSTYVRPVLIDPLYNDFTPLADTRVKDDLVELARRGGVDVDEVLVIDASRRTTAANAYVTGIGSTKRIVIYDTLLERFGERETRSVVAHELAHARYDDIPKGLLFVALVTPFGLFCVATLARRMGPKDLRRAGADAVPALILSVALVTTGVTWLSNGLSREVEARADAYALALTRDPAAFIDFKRLLALQNVSEPDPPALFHRVLGTHPTTMQRLGMAETFKRDPSAFKSFPPLPTTR